MNLLAPSRSHVVIQAPPQTVFTFFTENDRWASWWGAGSTIEPRSGGRVYIRHANGIESSGEVVEVVPPKRIVFTYGFNSGNPMPPGGSRVTINLESQGLGDTARPAARVRRSRYPRRAPAGWRYQLSVFGNVVADLVNAGAAEAVDAWYGAWSETSEDKRREQLRRIASADVRFRDRFSLLDGLADLVPHIGATQRFMPGHAAAARGDVRHCQGTLLVDWVAATSGGQERASGTNVFTLRADGMIESVTGFWDPPKQPQQ